MNAEQLLNLIGLALITFGGIAGAVTAPTPQYNADGSVSLSVAIQDKEKRVAIHKRQKLFPWFLRAVGFGASLQTIALFVSASHIG
jgi:hypothetical protein